MRCERAFECAFVCVLLLLPICYFCFHRTLLFLFCAGFFFSFTLTIGRLDVMRVQTGLSHALTQTYIRQVCRWRETNAQVNNRRGHQHSRCAHRKVCMSSALIIHPSLRVQLSFCTYKRAGACKWWGMSSHLWAVIGVCPSIPTEGCPY